MKHSGSLKKAIEAQYDILSRKYGPLGRMPRRSPIDVLVQTILSQNTTDVNSDKAYSLLRRRFPGWVRVMNADPSLLARTIRGGGLGNIKASRIREALKTICEREGRLSLARLKQLDAAEALSYLTSLPGVGVKTACCVLLFAFGMPVMPVDTHVYRVVTRLGWVKPVTHIDRVHESLESVVPGRRILPLHLYLISHGRELCRPRNPKCGACPLARGCAFFRKRLRNGW